MKRTKKLIAALDTLKYELEIVPFGKSADELYQMLSDFGYHWNQPEQRFEKRIIKPSVFDDKTFARIRIMAHPDSVQDITERLQKGFQIVEISDPYPNREDVGTRVYLMVKL